MPSKQTPQTLLDPTKITSDLVRSDSFLEQKREARNRLAVVRLLGRNAGTLAREQEKTLSVNEVLSMQLYESTIPFIEAQHALDRMRADEVNILDRDEVVAYKLDVIHFNHLIKDIFDKMPDLPIADVLNFVKTQILHQFSPELAKYAYQVTRESIVGMQHETAYEQMLYHIEGVDDIRGASEEEELLGVDYVFSYRSIPFAVDVKSSERNVQEAYIKGHDSAVWTHVPYEAFGGKFRLPYDEVQRYAPRIQADLDSGIATYMPTARHR